MNDTTQNGPLVSVYMPVYNESRFIRIAFDSLLGQTYRNTEYLVSDNCSTDDTWEIIREYAARDSRIKTHRQSHNLGMLKNAKTAMEMASGELIMAGSGNDYWAPTFVSSCVKELLSDSSVVMAYPRARWMDLDGKPMDIISTNLDTRGMSTAARVCVLLWGLGFYYQMQGLFRQEVFDDWEPKRAVSPDGLELMKAALMGSFAQVPEVLLHMRVAKSEMTQASAVTRHFEEGEDIQLTPDQLYYDMVRDYVSLVKEHFPPGLERDALVFSVVLACATRHRQNYQGVSRAAAGAPPPPARSDVESIIERFANEFDSALFGQESTENVLHRTAMHDVLRQFTTDELVDMMTPAELGHGVLARIRRAVRRRLSR